MQRPYSILKPGGNDTALVVGVELDAAKRKQINQELMQLHPNVEQVGFVNLDPDNAELMMAGGEFCGNATRSTAWQVLAGRPGEITIKVSGVADTLQAGVDETGQAWAQMPIYADPAKIRLLEDGTAIVSMEGITHVIVKDEYSGADGETLKKIAFAILEKHNLTQTVPASGVMFLTPTAEGVTMRPVVWVRDIATLFYESACGSGTTAVGLLEALKAGSSVDLPITQPSGMPISITVDYDGQAFERAVISGPVELLVDRQ